MYLASLCRPSPPEVHQIAPSARGSGDGASRRSGLLLALAANAALLLARRAPARVLALLPGCPIYRFTGLRCPGCGGTRAIFALLHGDLNTACHLNPLLLALSPLLVFYVVIALRSGSAPRVPPLLTSLLLLLTAGFTVARNI